MLFSVKQFNAEQYNKAVFFFAVSLTDKGLQVQSNFYEPVKQVPSQTYVFGSCVLGLLLHASRRSSAGSQLPDN